MAALLEGLPVMYNSVVKTIQYSAKEGVAVKTATHEFRGAHERYAGAMENICAHVHAFLAEPHS